MKATEHTCAYFAELNEGHCHYVFCESCPFAHYCDEACGWCGDGYGGYKPAHWTTAEVNAHDLADVDPTKFTHSGEHIHHAHHHGHHHKHKDEDAKR